MVEMASLFQHILAPTDGSEPAMRAGKMAVRLASLHGAKLTFVYVVDGDTASSLANTEKKDVKQVENELAASGQRSLDYLCRLAGEANLQADTFIRRGEPCVEITELAKEEGVDLIVIGEVGNRGLRRVLIGCVTERVIEYANCPVLVVKKS